MNAAFIYAQIIITALLLSIACIVPGIWLQLTSISLLSDAMSHAILLGIVITFFFIHTLHSFWFFIGAFIIAMIAMAIIQYLIQHQKLHKDAAIGIAFPALFSVAILLINVHTQTIHLDLDAILLGELAFTPLYQLTINGTDYGSYALWLIFIIMIINICSHYIWQRHLTTSSFDAIQAVTIGYKPQSIQWLIISISIITMIAAFECAGAMLVIAFMLLPVATARLITKSIPHIFALAVLISIHNTLLGFLVAHHTNAAIAASIALSQAFVFFLLNVILKIIKRNY